MLSCLASFHFLLSLSYDKDANDSCGFLVLVHSNNRIFIMAQASENTIRILRKTADTLQDSTNYAWGHVGKCNCGHLIQSVTAYSSNQIIGMAKHEYLDEWSEYANDYCSTTGSPVDDLINALIREGFSSDDIHHVEYLSDKSVLRALPGGFRHLVRNNKYDVVLYMRTWASVLELKLNEEKAKRKKKICKEALTVAHLY